MRAIGLFSIVIAVCGCSTNEGVGFPEDLSGYIEEIRERGTTEMAASHLQSIAGIRAGVTIISYPYDEENEFYQTRYRSTVCPIPNASPRELTTFREETLNATQEEFERLQLLADSDGSGFVSTEEAALYRRMVEFGWKVRYLEREGIDAGMLASQMGMEEQQFVSQREEYEEFTKHAGSWIVEGGPTRKP